MTNQNLTDKEWLDIFAEAKNDYILPYFPEKIKNLKKLTEEIEEVIRKKLKIIAQKSKPENQWFWEMYVGFWDGKDLMEVEKQIAHLQYLLALSQDRQNKQISKSRLTDEMVKEVKSKPIEAVVGSVVKLKKSGKNSIGLCPFHSEKSPSLYIYTATNSFYCFGCQKGGNTIKFVMEYYNLSFKEAIKFLNNY
jgi:hypothetical protein